MHRRKVLSLLIPLNLFAIWMSVAAWRLINQQTALADTVTSEEVAVTLQSGLYVAFGLSLILAVSTMSTVMLFWWQRRSVS